MEQNVQVSSGNVLVKKLGLILSVFVFLIPIFFVPISGVSLYVAKITLLATGLVAIFAIFLSSVLSTGIIEIPKVKYLIPIGAFAVVALVSSILTGVIDSSIAGDVFDLGTSGSILMLVFSLFLSMVAVKSIGTVGKVIFAFIYSSIFLAIYTLFGTFGSSLLPTAVSSKMPIFLSGGIIDTAIIFGAAVIFSLCALNMSEISNRMKYVLSALIVFSIIFIGAANFMPVIVMLGVVSMVFFVYILSWSFGNTEEQNKKISLSSLAVLIATVILLLGGSGISGYLSSVLRIQSTEIRPNFQTTMNLTVKAWQQNFALGVGPNRFADFWALNKPIEINQTQFWNADFYAGSGFIPTMAITTGLLGLLSLLSFIVLYVMSGIKAMFAQVNSGRSRYLATSSFLVSIYLWVMFFLYTPSIAVLALAFIFTGLFTATLVSQGTASLWKTNIFFNPKTNFISVLTTVVLLIMSVAGGYFVWERSVAATIFQNGILEYQKTGNLTLAKESMTRSIGLVSRDVYWRGLAEVSMADLGKILASITNQNQITDVIRAEAQTSIVGSVESSKKAVEMDRSNFKNWFALARVYEILASNGIEGSLESARATYTEATLRSPQNPSVPLALARLDSMSGNINGARENINKALELKNNFTDAYYTSAQLETASNNIPAAIKSAETATMVEPNNAGLYFQLGMLKYSQKDFAGAVGALERAVGLVSDYANAKYFLGISYYELGKKAEALKQFEDLSLTNPDNGEVKLILTNIKTGKSLFSNAKPPIDNKPEKRSEPPVEER